MIDPAVERQYSDTKELLALWKTFHDFFRMGVKGENLTPEKEAQFLDIKSKIAMVHDSFMDALTHDQNVGQEVLNIITRAITLKHLSKQSAADIKKMEIEWHESYLLVNETIGALEDKRRELSQINKAHYRTSKGLGVVRQKVTTFLSSFYFKAAVIITALLFATVGVQYMGIYDYNELGKYSATRTPYQMVKSIIAKNTPWICLDSLPWKPHMSWTGGFKPPEVKTDSQKGEVGKVLRLPASITQKLEAAAEYRKDVTTKEFKGDVSRYAFLWNDATSAEMVETELGKFAETPQGKALQYQLRWKRFVNAIVLIKGENEENINIIRDNVFRD